ncbi:hypothetical protein IFT59_07735 [Rhizobium sp. CFBP 8752]|uniref:hypothetical protein n=1 Tax=Rhizobium sp. CFBP 8752 TaxID=2775301 RepID=UPI001781B6D4|nr:hypothetical protein [Rhizobium sp. CFBP 8752]MBD8663143.1 hypothetical protein [Rhizobium sp. CFBP 8752]
MAALRSFAVMDATSRVSFQSVYQLMKYADPLGFLQQRLLEQGNYHTNMVKRASDDARDAFITSYEAINWSEVGGLQRFRNTALAHATFEDFSQSVTYGALERLVHLQCEMCHQLNLLYKGSAEHPIQRLNHARAVSSNFWLAVIKADADKSLDW